MQEEINHKTITVYIKGAKVTANSLKAALPDFASRRSKNPNEIKGKRVQNPK